MSGDALRPAPGGGAAPAPSFGIRLLDDLGSPRELIDLAVLAERSGFDSVWFPHDTLRANSWALAAAAAMATERVQIGSVGTNPWATHPAEIATYLATLDLLSGGRAALGLGIHTTEHLGWVDIDVEDPAAGTREAFEIITRLLRGEGPSYEGRWFRVTDQGHLRFAPRRPDPPVYICAFGERYLELSGEIGVGSLPMMTPPEGAAVMVEPIRRGAIRAGREPSELDVAGLAWLSISEDGDAARARLAEVAAYFGSYLEAPALATIGVRPEDYLPARERIMVGDREGARRLVSEEMLGLGIVGTPEECRDPVEMMIDAGVTNVLLGGPLGPDPAEAIELAAEELVEPLRSRHSR